MPVFDENELLARVDNDWEFLGETVQMLVTDGRGLMEQIRTASASGDALAVGLAAHTLKGMISNFCAPAAHATAFEVEKIGKGGDLAAAPGAVKTLETQLEALIAALNEFLATRNPSCAS
jgi:two-component system, sensor histidine kinase and response regulator